MLGGVAHALMTLVNTRIRIQDSGPGRAGTGDMGNSELCIGLLLPGTACRLLLTAGCLLPAAYCIWGSSWREPAPVPPPRTRCHTWQGKKNPSDFNK
jgi:hypothetical protein